MAESVARERRGGELAGNLDTSFLKVLALCFMFIDHLGAAVLPRIGELRMIGRMALPLYAWCLVVGSVKTRSAPRYALRLLGLALLSQPLYMMALNHTWTDLNILFLLFIGQVALQGIRARFMGSQVWVPALCYVLLGFVQVDYGWLLAVSPSPGRADSDSADDGNRVFRPPQRLLNRITISLYCLICIERKD